MIFVTLGTHEQPFDRALDLVAALQDRDRVLVQYGATPPRPSLPHVEWSEYLDWEPLTARMRAAEVVITQAGVGSAVTAIRAGKKPVLLPRLARFGEHVDDHQLQLAERLAEIGLAVVWTPDARVERVIAQAPPQHAASALEPAQHAGPGGRRRGARALTGRAAGRAPGHPATRRRSPGHRGTPRRNPPSGRSAPKRVPPTTWPFRSDPLKFSRQRSI